MTTETDESQQEEDFPEVKVDFQVQMQYAITHSS